MSHVIIAVTVEGKVAYQERVESELEAAVAATRESFGACAIYSTDYRIRVTKAGKAHRGDLRSCTLHGSKPRYLSRFEQPGYDFYQHGPWN